MHEPSDIFQSIEMRACNDKGCWKWLGSFNDKQIPYFSIEGRKVIAYRLVYELVNGEIPKGHVIRHTCDNGAAPIGCCNPQHLITGTHKQNMQDMVDRDRHGLPKHVVRAIRKQFKNAEEGKIPRLTQQQVADMWGVSRETISAIVNERVHTHEEDFAQEDERKERQVE